MVGEDGVVETKITADGMCAQAGLIFVNPAGHLDGTAVGGLIKVWRRADGNDGVKSCMFRKYGHWMTGEVTVICIRGNSWEEKARRGVQKEGLK